MISRQQIKEWIDNPVTKTLLQLCDTEYQNVLNVPVADCLCRGDPQRTQEQVLENATKLLEWEKFGTLLAGKFQELDYLEEFFKLVEEEDEDPEEDGSE